MNVNCIGIGAQKAATSWLSECLRAHPAIHMSPEKELHFFSDDSFFEKGLTAYMKRIGDVPQSATVIGEFSTSYLAHLDAPERMHSLFPEVKIIVSLRNPTDRALSHLEHLRSRGVLSPHQSAEDAVAQHPEIVANSLYGVALGRYLRQFRRDQIHVIFYDDIMATPKEIIRDLYAFLGVDTTFVPSTIYQQFNTAEVRSSSVYKHINATFFSLKKSFMGRSVLITLRSLGFTSQRLVWFLNQMYGTREYASDEARRYFEGLFRDDITVLEAELGIALPQWKR